MTRPIARVVEAHLVRGVTRDAPHYVVTVECPHCGKRYTHGWTEQGSNRVPHCGHPRDYRLVWDDAPAEAGVAS